MKKMFLLMLIVAGSLLWGNPQAYVVNTISMTLSKVDLTTGDVNNNFATLGSGANRIAIDGEYIYAINSLDNNMQKINLATGNVEATLNFENSSNPYDLVVVDGFAYVTGLITSKVYKINLSDFSIDTSVNVNTAPEGIAYSDGKLYVACTAVSYPTYGQSTVDVIDIENFSVINSINVALNCQNVVVSDTKIHAICTGNYSDVFGEADIIDPNTNTVINTLQLGGTPGSAYSYNNLIYVCDGYSYGTIVYNADTYEFVYSSDNPLSTFGASIFVDSNYIALTSADYSNNSTLKILDPNGVEISNYEVAVGAIDVLINGDEVANNDFTAPTPTWSVNAYPNPFANITTIKVTNNKKESPINGFVDIFNVKGQIVKTLPIKNGKTNWNGKNKLNRNCNSGIYFTRIRSGNKIISTKRITLIR